MGSGAFACHARATSAGDAGEGACFGGLDRFAGRVGCVDYAAARTGVVVDDSFVGGGAEVSSLP